MPRILRITASGYPHDVTRLFRGNNSIFLWFLFSWSSRFVFFQWSTDHLCDCFSEVLIARRSARSCRYSDFAHGNVFIIFKIPVPIFYKATYCSIPGIPSHNVMHNTRCIKSCLSWYGRYNKQRGLNCQLNYWRAFPSICQKWHVEILNIQCILSKT